MFEYILQIKEQMSSVLRWVMLKNYFFSMGNSFLGGFRFTLCEIDLNVKEFIKILVY